MLAHAHYLYWACYRGNLKVALYIIEELGVSPFLKTYEGRSALMAAIRGKRKASLKVQ